MRERLIELWNDPAVFSYIIMTLYVCQCIRYAFARNWAMCLYWFAAFQITLAVTWAAKIKG